MWKAQECFQPDGEPSWLWKTGPSLKHCLAHCTSYLAENVAGKATMLVRSKNCVICLHPNQGVDKCFDKDNTKRVCGLDGCVSHHHPSLHGAKDPQVANCSVTTLRLESFGSRGQDIQDK